MTYSKAKEQFEIRYYLWGASEFQQEIDGAFPHFRLFKTGSVWKLHQFMEQLEKRDRHILAAALLKRFHPDAARTLGETETTEEASLRSRWDALPVRPSDLQAAIWAKQEAGQKVKFASKPKLRRTILQGFKQAYGAECLDLACAEFGPELDFKMKCCGWVIDTHFEFAEEDRQIHYWHTIMSPTEPGSPIGPDMMIGRGISFNAWLGVTSQTKWQYLMEEDIQAACNSVIKFCGHFLSVAPKLLKGLDFDTITDGNAAAGNP
jgi:hypothetical protein